jgi:pyruvate,water dikinase
MSGGTSIAALEDIRFQDIDFAGGKAAGLGEIVHVGCNVPAGFVVPRHYRDRWASGRLDIAFESEVARWCLRIGGSYFAVRSSALIEDGGNASWAGQYATFLGVSPVEVAKRIVDCWLSPGSPHATAYAAHRNALEARWDMAVVVQTMIASEFSGVMFTVDPVSSQDRFCSVEVVAGLGEPLVQGRVTPQSYLLDRVTGEVIQERRSRQQVAMVQSEAGVETVDLPSGWMGRFSHTILRDLVQLGRRLEQHFGRPQDVEWAFASNTLYVLQSRPITTINAG